MLDSGRLGTMVSRQFNLFMSRAALAAAWFAATTSALNVGLPRIATSSGGSARRWQTARSAPAARPQPPTQLRAQPTNSEWLEACETSGVVSYTDFGIRLAPYVAPATGLRARLKRATSFKKEDIAKLGVSAFFSYGFVSNVNSVLLLSFTWATFRRANPLVNPLSESAILLNPMTWFPLKKAFLAYYVGYYATVGSLLRPFRFAVAVGLAPAFDKTYTYVQDKLRVPRAVAMFLVTMVANVAFTVALLIFAVNVMCAALRVPPVPL